MKTDELNHNIDELKYVYSFWSPKILTVHKGLFEDELEDSIHKRKTEVKRKKEGATNANKTGNEATTVYRGELLDGIFVWLDVCSIYYFRFNQPKS